jgi:hypothetical protein
MGVPCCPAVWPGHVRHFEPQPQAGSSACPAHSTEWLLSWGQQARSQCGQLTPVAVPYALRHGTHAHARPAPTLCHSSHGLPCVLLCELCQCTGVMGHVVGRPYGATSLPPLGHLHCRAQQQQHALAGAVTMPLLKCWGPTRCAWPTAAARCTICLYGYRRLRLCPGCCGCNCHSLPQGGTTLHC